MRSLVLFCCIFLAATISYADSNLEELLLKKGIITKEELDALKKEDAKEKSHTVTTSTGIHVDYKRKKGLVVGTDDGNWEAIFNLRSQMRFSAPFDSDPRQLDDFLDDPDQYSFNLRRVRIKMKGHAYRPWIGYNFELDLQPTNAKDTRLINWFLDLKKWDEFKIRFGQWKINYNRERVDSSGKQQFVERSIVNRIFTVDRQVGIMGYGNLFERNLTYYGGLFNGEGRGTKNPDSHMMWLGRIQYNPWGRILKYSQSDIERHRKPAGSISFAVAGNKGSCTRWSSSGCGSLDGFSKDIQNDIFQWTQGSAFKWNGFSWQQEYHFKRIKNEYGTYNLNGLYAQSGYFFNELFSVVPEELEFAFRYAWLQEPSVVNGMASTMYNNNRQEFTFATNYYILGHRNKITLDASHLTLNDGYMRQRASENRVRLQWDVTW